jgi:membrane-bound lytic murein transglycosylase D
VGKASGASSYTIYRVKKGDVLGRIAQRHHVTVSQLKKWNNLRGDFIREGQKLKIYKS